MPEEVTRKTAQGSLAPLSDPGWLDERVGGTKDALTGLPSERYFLEQVEIERVRAEHTGRVFTLIRIEVDELERLRSLLGPAGISGVLTAIAGVLQVGAGRVRKCDLAARTGEAFSVLLPETPLAGAEATAEQIRRAVESITWSEVSGLLAEPVTVSAALIAYPDHGQSADRLLRVGEVTASAARRAGGNRVLRA